MTGGSLMVPLCSSDRESTIEEKPKFHQFRPHRLLVKPSNNNSYDFIYFSDAENHPKENRSHSHLRLTRELEGGATARDHNGVSWIATELQHQLPSRMSHVIPLIFSTTRISLAAFTALAAILLTLSHCKDRAKKIVHVLALSGAVFTVAHCVWNLVTQGDMPYQASAVLTALVYTLLIITFSFITHILNRALSRQLSCPNSSRTLSASIRQLLKALGMSMSYSSRYLIPLTILMIWTLLVSILIANKRIYSDIMMMGIGIASQYVMATAILLFREFKILIEDNIKRMEKSPLYSKKSLSLERIHARVRRILYLTIPFGTLASATCLGLGIYNISTRSSEEEYSAWLLNVWRCSESCYYPSLLTSLAPSLINILILHYAWVPLRLRWLYGGVDKTPATSGISFNKRSSRSFRYPCHPSDRKMRASSNSPHPPLARIGVRESISIIRGSQSRVNGRTTRCTSMGLVSNVSLVVGDRQSHLANSADKSLPGDSPALRRGVSTPGTSRSIGKKSYFAERDNKSTRRSGTSEVREVGFTPKGPIRSRSRRSVIDQTVRT
ncbi:hypothetical protein AAMO2058_001580400 [Amorphochlora amoebiformis]